MSEEQKPASVYLRLTGIYEGDVKIDKDQHAHSFLLHCVDLDGKQYICPIACMPIYDDSVRKSLSRVKPVVLTFTENKGEVKDSTITPPSDEITQVQGEISTVNEVVH